MPAESINGYFAKLNPIAEKISIDINEVKLAYDQVWLTLTVMEQEKILNDTLIRSEISSQYFKSTKRHDNLISRKQNQLELSAGIKLKETVHSNYIDKEQKKNAIYSFDGQSLITFIRQNVGWKLLHDENYDNFGDEHSFPFCHRTKSQINLLASISIPDITPAGSNLALSSPHSRLASRPKHQANLTIQPSSLIQPSQDLIENSYSYSNTEERHDIIDSTFKEHTVLSISIESTDSETDFESAHSQLLPGEVKIPKGFDFLSNW